jgi:hypothetical protein
MNVSLLAIGALLPAAACHSYDVRASDGGVVHQSSWDDWAPTVKASGAHDLACDAVRVYPVTRDLRAAEGCGRRAIYGIHDHDTSGGFEAVLISVLPLDPAASPGP